VTYGGVRDDGRAARVRLHLLGVRDQSTREGQHEYAPVLELHDDMTDAGELYGARKAAAERIVPDAYGDRALIPRPGLIVGPARPDRPLPVLASADRAPRPRARARRPG
jgi:nucleoside-diphosphate-sugar epimerase